MPLQQVSITQTNELSLYQDKPAEVFEIARELAKLQVSFPDISREFISVLAERVVRNGFTLERLRASIGNVLDNFQYKKPNISDIIGFDKKIKLYTYHEVYRLIEKGDAEWSDFDIVEVNGNKFRIKKTDNQLFNQISHE
jgi:hypothetical protein